jgi:hypothetical protein
MGEEGWRPAAEDEGRAGRFTHMSQTEETQTYPVLSTIRKDGKVYKPNPGQPVLIALTDREAEELRALEAIGEPIVSDPPSPQPSPAGEGGKAAKGRAK